MRLPHDSAQHRQLQSTCITKRTFVVDQLNIVLQFNRDIGNVFKLVTVVVILLVILIRYGLFRFHKRWKLFSWSCSVRVLFMLFMNNIWRGQKFSSDNGWLCQLWILWYNATNEYFNYQNRFDWLFVPLLCSPEFTRCRTQEKIRRSSKTLNYKYHFVLLSSSFIFWLAIYTDSPKYGQTLKNIQRYNKESWLRSVFLFRVLFMSNLMKSDLMRDWSKIVKFPKGWRKRTN